MTSAINCLFGVAVYLSDRKKTLNVIWLFLSLAASLWIFGLGKMVDASVYSQASFWLRGAHYGGAIFLPSLYFHFTAELLAITKEKRRLIVLFYVVSVILCVTNVLGYFATVQPKGVFQFYTHPKFFYHFYTIHFLFSISYSLFLMSQKYALLGSIKKQQVKYQVLATIIGFGGGGTTLFYVYNINIFPFGVYVYFLYTIIMSYAIYRYRLLDIKVALTKASIFLIIYSFVLGIPVGVGLKYLGGGLWIMPMTLMAVFATIGPFVYLYIQKKTEAALLQEQRQYQMRLQQASFGMGQIKDLRRLLNLIVHIITQAVRIEHAEIYLLHEDSGKFALKASRGWPEEKNQLSVIDPASPLVSHLKGTRKAMVYEEVEQSAQNDEVKEFKDLRGIVGQLGGVLIVPSFMDQTLIAILVLGNKRSRRVYTSEDLAVFTILANQAGLAIENAQFYEKMKEAHSQLVKAEKMATVGTMADGLSHQINNRLHAMGFIAGDLMDTVKLKRKNNLSDTEKGFLDEVEHSLGRIEDNVKRGGEIVAGLLKYTRKGSEGFENINLNTLLQASLEMARFKIKLDQIKFIREFDDTIPDILGNFTQLQEVFFNIIDNAYDAMMQRKADLKEPGYEARLKVSASWKDYKLEILIQDNGIGVRKEDLGKLFMPFFTTKLSSKRGTGLGLYVIRQLIEENHGGKVEFTSVYKKGSRMRILLPIVMEG